MQYDATKLIIMMQKLHLVYFGCLIRLNSVKKAKTDSMILKIENDINKERTTAIKNRVPFRQLEGTFESYEQTES